MDLLKLKKQALLIPTPGQTEQHYLASRLNKFGWFYTQQQDELDVRQGISRALNMTGSRPIFNFEGYKQALGEIISEKNTRLQ
jgi:predicted glycosyltransferase